MIGVKQTRDALSLAYDAGLDLVEIVPSANPPVCKIVDYTKYKYDQERKERTERKKQKLFQLKEVRFRPKIEEHDLEFKINHIREFLAEKHKVKVTIMFLGRELEHRELGYSVLEKIKTRIVDLGAAESREKMEGNRIVVLFAPTKK
jgi:translation initiation factor IF-3